MSQLFKLKNGTVLLSTEAPGGVYNSGQLKKIAELCSKELAVVKATEDQRLALFVKESEVEKVVAQLQTMGLGVRNYQAGLHQPVTCLGELCEQHDQPALASAMDLTRAISEIALKSSLKIGINGCARCCTPCHTFDISILGEPSGYRISLGGKNSQFPELSSFFAEAVPASELPRLIKGVIKIFEKQAEEGETLHAVLERCGIEEFVQALAPYSQDAAHRDDPFAGAAETSDIPEAASSENQDDDISIDDDFNLEELEESISLEDNEPATAARASPQPAPAATEDLFDEGLDEIPIEKEAGSLLGDDISLADDEAGLGTDIVLEDSTLSDEDLNIDAALLEEEEIPAPAPSPAPPLAQKNLATEAAPDPLSELEDESLLELESEELSFDELSETEVAPLEMSSSEELLEEEISFTEESEPESHAEISLEAENLDEIDESAELDPSLQIDSEIELSEEPDAIELEDEEGIPELDGGLDPEVLETPAKAPAAPATRQESPMSAAAAVASAPIPEGTFDEGLELENLSDEEESNFEAKLQASIEEESRLLASVEEDPNETDRQAALDFLENQEKAAVEKRGKTLELPRRAPTGKAPAQRFAGLSFEQGLMRLAFTSGAYIDVDLSSLTVDEERVLNLGGMELKVVQSAEGYTVELDGMRMFYPRNALQSAS